MSISLSENIPRGGVCSLSTTSLPFLLILVLLLSTWVAHPSPPLTLHLLSVGTGSYYSDTQLQVQCNLCSDGEWHNAIFAKLLQMTHITLWLFTCEIPEKIRCLLENNAHSDSGTDTLNHSDYFLLVSPTCTSCTADYYAQSEAKS